MLPVFFARFWPCDPAQVPNDEFPVRRTNSLFCSGTGNPAKALGLLREMTVRLAKTVKKDQKSAKFPVLFPVFRESGPWNDPLGETQKRGTVAVGGSFVERDIFGP